MKAKFLSLGLAAVFATPIAVVFSQRQALALCKGSGCNGQDPGTSGCATANPRPYVVARTNDRVTTVEEFYSPACNANWVRATTPIFSTLYLLEAIPGGTIRRVEYRTSVNGQSYTDMWDGNQKYKACVDRPLLDPICTSTFK